MNWVELGSTMLLLNDAMCVRRVDGVRWGCGETFI
jgi:hypothetical protein